MADKSDLQELRNSLAENAKLVSNLIGDEWDQATVWSPVEESFPEWVTIQNSYESDGTAPAVDEDEVSGWNKYELSA